MSENINALKVDYIKYDGNYYKMIPAAPSSTERGGIIAELKDESYTVEVKIGNDGKLYVPENTTELDKILIDNKLDEESENPVQNKVITEAFNQKLDTLKLPEAVNSALEQAKASGEFDGADGKNGLDGQDGEDGVDGITPHIGTNGNWFIGTTDTGNPSRGEKGDAGEKGLQGIQGEKGEKGDKGDTGNDGADGVDGKTPVKGVDYFTQEDKTSFVTDVLNALPTWQGGAY